MAGSTDFPAAYDDFADVPVFQSSTPTHKQNHDDERAAIDALQAHVGMVGEARLVQRFADTAARDAAIPSPVTGMECWAGTSKYAYVGGSWILTYAPWVTVNSGEVPESGWATNTFTARTNGIIMHLFYSFERTGADITVPASGNIGNTNIVTLPAGCRGSGSFLAGLHSQGQSGKLASGHYNISNGVLGLGAVAAGSDIVTGEVLSLTGVVGLAWG